ncbi:thioesterase [Nostocoides sp. F2B08]|uniref:thioesterase family protein n=1 Tax=Nostocoides sp. F2B08 TaxID=2653936 RepID=UPI001263772C|nr:hotdog domain-containing protein [Tetrasphaera sp. F2B08]KAB7743536.1 thioesterase [Tetrasphaera sp. F2B08]
MPAPQSPPPQSATLSFTVGEDDTALAVGSGSLPVLGTPRLLAWCEAATCAALSDLAPGTTSVGTRVEVEHLAPNAVGDVVVVHAETTGRTDRTVTFTVEARHLDHLVARGVVTRAVVDSQRFMARLAGRADD